MGPGQKGLMAMKNENRVSGMGRIVPSRYLRLLPSIPRKRTWRNKIADGLLMMLTLLARTAFIAGAIIGGHNAGAKGFLLGLAAGAAIGFWIRRSAGMRGRDLTYGFYLRMSERGMGKSPSLLESVVEKIRGEEISPYQGRLLNAAYSEFQRALRVCDSAEERGELSKTLERKVQIALYGRPETTAPNDSGVLRGTVAGEI
jgi:hypothetical protein